MNAKLAERTLIPVIIAALTILSLAACAGSGTNTLRNTAWELAFLEGSELLPGTAIAIEFTADQVSGSAGCNHYEESYKVSGDSLTISGVFATEMGCLEPAGILGQETAYLTALRGAARYQLGGDRLKILDETGAIVLTFAAPS